MVVLAQAYNIKVILCALTPISDKTAAGGTQSRSRPQADILKLNTWLKEYAAKIRAPFVDYYAAVVDAGACSVPG